ncbi:MAG: helix-hairpin-helix domain-containing protein [Phreatobacter sp.]|nr:helix-hairpin-helix domain-containing protein [Phreatobacter sp.]
MRHQPMVTSPGRHGRRSLAPSPEPDPRKDTSMLKTLMLAASLALAGTAAMAQTATQPATRPTAPATTPAPAATTTPAAALIDINSATETELRVLPGIGEARAKAIIAGRPYRGKDELVRKNIIPQSVYDGIQARIVARQR